MSWWFVIPYAVAAVAARSHPVNWLVALVAALIILLATLAGVLAALAIGAWIYG